jgi:hypothetical protein
VSPPRRPATSAAERVSREAAQDIEAIAMIDRRKFSNVQ